MSYDLSGSGITGPEVHRNPSVPTLYKMALVEKGCSLADTGALIAYSGAKTGRSPKDKRVVKEPANQENIWWGSINMPIPQDGFEINRKTALDYLCARPQVFCIDGFAGWDPRYRKKIRIVCERAYHALFMHNMLIRPTPEELKDFGDPDWVIYNSGRLEADPNTPGVDTKTSVNVNFAAQEMVILGSEYAGEMKKGVFTVLNYILPAQSVLSMHCSANEGTKGDVALFFGLSGTGKTTLSADPKRRLIGDDEHGWSDAGVFNFEGGCYAKTICLSAESEPQIWEAIRFGSILENVVCDEANGAVDYDDGSITENTRTSYPVEYIPNVKIPCVGGHPENIVLLTCDAFGVLPPVSRLTPAQAMYHFISGYTAKVAGTEVGVTEPEATFSACFGAAFLVWHPTVYAELLKKKMQQHQSKVWLINTGWSGGAHGVGSRMKLSYTRAIVDAVLDGSLDNATWAKDEVFGLEVPTKVPGVPDKVLMPRNTWSDKAAYDQTAKKLAALFNKNFEKFADKASAEILAAAPRTAALAGAPQG
ncbi:MAG: phosphoenolpyruvate carboxykinase (ATP) [bacterium]|nr:phosphoenolpyruvate carboxykinase (ATP) [bacterium]